MLFNLTWLKFQTKWSTFTVRQDRNTKSIKRERGREGKKKRQIDAVTDIGGGDRRYYREVNQLLETEKMLDKEFVETMKQTDGKQVT